MKECPVCKESFSEDMYFCDLDGTPLDSGGDGRPRSGSSRLWSTLGIVALLAAVVISAVAIVFFPRGFSPAASVSTAQTKDNGGLHPVAPAQDTSAEPDSLSPSAGAVSTDDNSNSARLDRNGNVDSMAKLAARRAQLLKNQNGDSSLPNPKAAFESTPDASVGQSGDDASAKARPRVTKPADPVDPIPDVKPAAVKSADAVDKADSDASAKKKNSKTSSSLDKNSNANKKKGGFLKMFKKIFG
ncbi:MAG TPA: hypothetical protein VI756_01715 [Blastocatellia bacterium]